MANKEVCGGTSPWYGSEKAVSAALDLNSRGIPVAGLTEDQLLAYQKTLYSLEDVPAATSGSQPKSTTGSSR